MKKYWGFENFRPQQEDIVEDAINGHDVLALLPTGGGKSVCFQIPGLAREGITLVITPLIALMQDQVLNLQKAGIKAISITSAMTFREIDIALDNIKFGSFKFLYTSPERINTILFRTRFKQMNVGLIVVDEAHCISEWGHDFRPSYFSISELRLLKPNVPMMALTATATKTVQSDIIDKLSLKNVRIHEASFIRKNLSYNFNKVSNKLNFLIQYSRLYCHDSGIIYCQTRKSVKEVAKKLISNKISCGIYHGGMNSTERSNMLSAWLTEKIKVMVATNAFGMGIDKPNVRYVLHFEIPNSIEAYFQEAGRGGRDGKEANAIALVDGKEEEVFLLQLQQKYPSVSHVLHSYIGICNYLRIAIGSGLNEVYPIDLKEICHSYQLDYSTVYHSLKLLENAGYLSFNEGFHSPTTVMICIDQLEIYNFQIQHPKFQEIISILIRMNSQIFYNFQVIKEEDLSKKMKTSVNEVELQLNSLIKYGVIDVKWRTELPLLTFSQARCSDQDFSLPNEIYHERKKNTELKMSAMSNLIKSEICRSQTLIEYFGQSSSPCGICDICMSKTKKLKDHEIQSFLKTEKSIFEICLYFSSDEESVNKILRRLIQEETIKFNGVGYISI